MTDSEVLNSVKKENKSLKTKKEKSNVAQETKSTLKKVSLFQTMTNFRA